MGIQEIRAAFNDAAAKRLTCIAARMRYVPGGQVLEFDGTRAIGTPFSHVTEPIPPGADLLNAARQAALDQLGAKPAETPPAPEPDPEPDPELRTSDGDALHR